MAPNPLFCPGELKSRVKEVFDVFCDDHLRHLCSVQPWCLSWVRPHLPLLATRDIQTGSKILSTRENSGQPTSRKFTLHDVLVYQFQSPPYQVVGPRFRRIVGEHCVWALQYNMKSRARALSISTEGLYRVYLKYSSGFSPVSWLI